MMCNITISILGCGWFGKAMAVHLIGKGYTVKGSTTSPSKLPELQALGIRPYLIDLSADDIQTDFFDCDILIVACGPNIGKLANYPVKRLIFISSTGVYGQGDVDENSEPDTSKPHHIAEQQLTGPHLTVIRFAGLTGPGRVPGRFLAGKKDLPNGDAPVNLIHLTDCIGLTEAVMAHPEIRLINGVSPDHPSRKSFYQLAAAQEGLVMPEFNEVSSERKLVSSIYPDRYRYQVDNWIPYLMSGQRG